MWEPTRPFSLEYPDRHFWKSRMGILSPPGNCCLAKVVPFFLRANQIRRKIVCSIECVKRRPSKKQNIAPEAEEPGSSTPDQVSKQVCHRPNVNPQVVVRSQGKKNSSSTLPCRSFRFSFFVHYVSLLLQEQKIDYPFLALEIHRRFFHFWLTVRNGATSTQKKICKL